LEQDLIDLEILPVQPLGDAVDEMLADGTFRVWGKVGE
jgi:hypothetical protein